MKPVAGTNQTGNIPRSPKSLDPKDDTQTLELIDILNATVQRATGIPESEGRPGQVRLAQAIQFVFEECYQHLGEAGTGVGKSLAYLVPAALEATKGKRTVISTESLSLQTQLAHKDAPVVQETIKELTGKDIDIAVYKGWANYVCAMATQKASSQLLNEPGHIREETAKKLDESTEEEASLYAWAIRQLNDDEANGDRAYAPAAQSWHNISVGTDACVGVDKCPFSNMCKPAKAKLEAAIADIIITNHTLLAIQAANAIPTVIGNKVLHDFDNIVVDEAHALPAHVRNQGAVTISARRFERLAKSLSFIKCKSAHRGDELESVGLALAAHCEKTISVLSPDGKTRKLGENDNPIQPFEMQAFEWLRNAAELIRDAVKEDPEDLKIRRTKTSVSSFLADLSSVADHIPGVARWVENDEIKSSPVAVSNKLVNNLYEAPINEVPRTNRSVVMVSATLPENFHNQVGLNQEPILYESPFKAAYSNSALFIPKAIQNEDIQALSSPYSDKPRFDTASHALWAIKHILNLVKASGGRALILAAKAEDGKTYAEALRDAQEPWQILDQWTAPTPASAVKQWREDETSVLVGTRSLMTGTDAPGRTNQLVIIDRVPRSPANPVDDARREAIQVNTGLNRWAADGKVYVSDAATLLKQAEGRLIRSQNDRGMVAILDPRLLKKNGSAFSYPENTRQTYMRALGPFGHRLTEIEEAEVFFSRIEQTAPQLGA